jgi:hypothetical protein
MYRLTHKLVVAAVVLVFARFAAAQPGTQLLTFRILPQDVPKVVAALDTYMASSAGQQFKGRATLRARIADGNDPATHSLSFWFHSQAEDEAYTSAGANAPELRAMLDTIVPIASLVATSRASIVRSWGDPSDADVVWLALASEVSDVVAFNAALDKWLASPMGKKSPGQGYLLSVWAGGNDSPTHVGLLGYASLAEMEQYRDGLAGDPDYQAFQLALGKASRRIGATLTRDVKSWGPAKLQSFKP